MIKILIVSTIILLAGCGRDNYSVHSSDFSKQCLDGVTYWFKADVGSYKGYLAVYINPETMQPEKCNG